MTKVFFVSFITIIFIGSCATDQKKLSNVDSITVFKSSLASKLFSDDVSNYSDTIYIIKNEYYVREYPLETGKLKIMYIDDLAENKTLNRPNRPVDRRERFGITKFDKSRDTVFLDLFNYGASECFKFKLKKVKDDWKIISEQISTVNVEVK